MKICLFDLQISFKNVLSILIQKNIIMTPDTLKLFLKMRPVSSSEIKLFKTNLKIDLDMVSYEESLQAHKPKDLFNHSTDGGEGGGQ